MLVLIQNLSYYMMVEVVEPAWHSLVVSLATCTTVDDVLQKHNDFLDNCLHDCLLSSPQVDTRYYSCRFGEIPHVDPRYYSCRFGAMPQVDPRYCSCRFGAIPQVDPRYYSCRFGAIPQVDTRYYSCRFGVIPQVDPRYYSCGFGVITNSWMTNS